MWTLTRGSVHKLKVDQQAINKLYALYNWRKNIIKFQMTLNVNQFNEIYIVF